MVLSVPDEAGFAEAGSRRHDRLVAGLGGFLGLVESDGVGWAETLDSPCLRLKIVDQVHGIEVQFLREPRCVYDPGKV